MPPSIVVKQALDAEHCVAVHYPDLVRQTALHVKQQNLHAGMQQIIPHYFFLANPSSLTNRDMLHMWRSKKNYKCQENVFLEVFGTSCFIWV